MLPATGTHLALLEVVEGASTTSLPRARRIGEAATTAAAAPREVGGEGGRRGGGRDRAWQECEHVLVVQVPGSVYYRTNIKY